MQIRWRVFSKGFLLRWLNDDADARTCPHSALWWPSSTKAVLFSQVRQRRPIGAHFYKVAPRRLDSANLLCSSIVKLQPPRKERA